MDTLEEVEDLDLGEEDEHGLAEGQKETLMKRWKQIRSVVNKAIEALKR